MFDKGQELYQLSEWSWTRCLICQSQSDLLTITCLLFLLLAACLFFFLMLQKNPCEILIIAPSLSEQSLTFFNLSVHRISWAGIQRISKPSSGQRMSKNGVEKPSERKK